MSELDDRMTALRERFRERAALQRGELEAAFAAGETGEVRRIAHSLAGNGGTFGFPEISEAADRVDQAVGENTFRDRLAPLVRALLAALDHLREKP